MNAAQTMRELVDKFLAMDALITSQALELESLRAELKTLRGES